MNPEAKRRLENLARPHRSELNDLALLLVGDLVGASELVEGAFESGAEQLERFTPGAHVGSLLASWLYQRFIERMGGLRLAAPPATAMVEQGWSRLTVDQLDAAAAELPSELQRVYALHVAGLSYQQISLRLELPRAAVEGRLTRARRAVRERLGPLLEAGRAH